MEKMRWITRVPLTIKKAKELIGTLDVEEIEITKEMNSNEKEEYSDSSEISYQVNGINKKLKFFKIREIEIVEVTNKEGKTVFKLKGEIGKKSEEIEKKRKETGRFILATNIQDESLVSDSEILEKYKEQSVCEKGFAFLKDPLFFADSFFVEKPERIQMNGVLFWNFYPLLVINIIYKFGLVIFLNCLES